MLEENLIVLDGNISQLNSRHRTKFDCLIVLENERLNIGSVVVA